MGATESDTPWEVGLRQKLKMAGPCPEIVSILALRVTPMFIGFTNHFFCCSSTDSDKNHNWIIRTHFGNTAFYETL